MKKIMLLLVLASALENAFASNTSKISQQPVAASQAMATPKTASDPKQSEASHENAEPKERSKWYSGTTRAWCKSWKEHGAAWEFWPLYKMGKTSCEPNNKE